MDQLTSATRPGQIRRRSRFSGVLCVAMFGWQSTSLAQSQAAPTNPSNLAPVPPTKVVHDYGYDYDGVCVFAELVEGYQLPTLSKNFYSDTKHFKMKSTEKEPNGETIEVYSYSGPGISAEIIGWPAKAFFLWHSALMDPSRLPEAMRDKRNIVGFLEIAHDKSTGDVISLGCETHTVTFHFDKDRLIYVEFDNGIVD
jgi:hypothetical protein